MRLPDAITAAIAGLVVLTAAGCAIVAGGAAGVAGGFLAGKLTDPLTDIDIANKALALDAPLKRLWCRDHPSRLRTDAGLATYCAHVPESVPQALVTWARVFAAWDTGKVK